MLDRTFNSLCVVWFVNDRDLSGETFGGFSIIENGKKSNIEQWWWWVTNEIKRQAGSNVYLHLRYQLLNMRRYNLRRDQNILKFYLYMTILLTIGNKHAHNNMWTSLVWTQWTSHNKPEIKENSSSSGCFKAKCTKESKYDCIGEQRHGSSVVSSIFGEEKIMFHQDNWRMGLLLFQTGRVIYLFNLFAEDSALLHIIL